VVGSKVTAGVQPRSFEQNRGRSEIEYLPRVEVSTLVGLAIFLKNMVPRTQSALLRAVFCEASSCCDQCTNRRQKRREKFDEKLVTVKRIEISKHDVTLKILDHSQAAAEKNDVHSFARGACVDGSGWNRAYDILIRTRCLPGDESCLLACMSVSPRGRLGIGR
jgi:hypothetical protein